MDKIIICDNYFDGDKFIKTPKFLVIKNGIITKIDNFCDTVPSNLDKNAIVEDYRGLTLTPGLVDSHNHFTLTALKMRFQISLEAAHNFEDIKSILLENIQKKETKWILGYGLNEFNLDEKKLPTVKELDTVSKKIPIFITNATEHYAVCNSIALQKSNITIKNNDLNNFSIGRFANGEPNGILYEFPAMNLVKKHIPKYSTEDYEEALLFAAKMYKKSGLTTVKDIGGTGDDIDDEKRIIALNKLTREKRLDIRVGIALPIFSHTEVNKKIELAKTIEENAYLKFVGFKLFLDGSSLSRTAWSYNEWNINYSNIDKNNYGMCLWDMKEFKEVISELSSINSTISVHAIGDRAIHEILEIIKNNNKNSNFTIIHCYIPNANDINEIKKLNVSIETQAPLIYFDGAALMSNFGAIRGKNFFPLKSMLNAGINVCNGSDSPVTSYKPIYGIIASMNRQPKDKMPSGFEYNKMEKLSFEETIKTYTSNCSRSMNWNEIGNIKVGSFADLIVWEYIPESIDAVIENKTMFRKIIISGD